MSHTPPVRAAGPGQEPGPAALLRAPATRPLPACWWYDPRTLVVADADAAVRALCADDDTGARSEAFRRPPGWDGGRQTALPGRTARLSWTQPAFTAAAVRAQAPALLSAADACLDRTPPPASDWDVLPTVLETTAHLAAVLCLGGDAALVHGLDAPLRAATPAVVRGAGQPCQDGAHDRFERAAAAVDDRLRAALRRRRAAAPAAAGHDLLSVLLAEPAADDEAVLTVLFSRLFSAQTAPGLLTAWLLHLLATHPAEQRRLRAEARRVLGPSGTPPAVDPAQLTATQHALREALRLYPPSWLLGRTLRRPVRLADHDLAPGTEIRVATYLIHRDPAHHPRPDAFVPGRWATPRPGLHRGAYLPFGIGDRYCRGASWVTAIAALTTAALLRRHHLRPTPGGRVTPHFSAHLEPAGLRLDPHPAPPG
ncbi:cytochrome P450 [Streptomyces sp. NPDC052020]|uniref:cytochrome P450 n=1 Tax=Streptomyces sp. NPDC052020 TaxID=3155677 RepID=UPI00341241A5